MNRKIYDTIKILSVWTALVVLLAGNITYAHGIAGEAFTPEEQDYITRKKTVKAAVIDDWQPISSLDGKYGAPRGLAVDIIRRFEKETGLTVEYIEAKDYMHAIKMAENGQADIAVLAAVYSDEQNTYQLELSDAYLESGMMMLRSKNTDLSDAAKYTVAEIEGYPILSQNPSIIHKPFHTPAECLAAIRAGQVDAMYCDIYTGLSYTQRYTNRELVSIPINVSVQLRFGICTNESAVLKPLLNQTIAGINRNDINESLAYNRTISGKSLGDFVYSYPFEIICVIITISVLTIMSIVIYMRIKNRQSVSIQGYAASYQMFADTVGEAGFKYDYMTDKLSLFGKSANKLAMPSEISNFSAYLERPDKEISLTNQQFEKMLSDGLEQKAYDVELTCKLNNGKWQHFRLTFSVVSTAESYHRPISLLGFLTNAEKAYQEKEQLIKLGMYDNITGLYNRAGAESEIKKRLTPGTDITNDLLLMIDVDHFKHFNDVYGHQCGDAVLKCMGYHLKRIFYKEDILCRWGGDEFMLYIINAAENMESIEQKCEALQTAMKECSYENASLPATLSIGGAIIGSRSVEETFQLADKALYTVKEQGRDAIQIITE